MHFNTCNTEAASKWWLESKGRACKMRSADVCRLDGERGLHASEPSSPWRLTQATGGRSQLWVQYVKLASISANKGRESGGGLVTDIHPKPCGSYGTFISMFVRLSDACVVFNNFLSKVQETRVLVLRFQGGNLCKIKNKLLDFSLQLSCKSICHCRSQIHPKNKLVKLHRTKSMRLFTRS